MSSKFLKVLSLSLGVLALSAVIVSAEEKKDDGKCPCEKEHPKALVTEEPSKETKKCPGCPDEKPKALIAADEPSKEGKCPCEKEKTKV